jgi:murein DD-endopeptidase MepM/ murein hydrolase activator NlpD
LARIGGEYRESEEVKKLLRHNTSKLVKVLMKSILSTGFLILSVAVLLRPVYADGQSAAPWITLLSDTVTQGGLIRGKLNQPGRLIALGREVPVAPSGDFVLGLGRDYEGELALDFQPADGGAQQLKLPVARRDYNIQRINGIAKKYMSPGEAALKRIRQEVALVRKTRQKTLRLEGFLEPFEWPLIGRITGVYGSQRVFNGEPRRPHYGIDIAAPAGSLVKAPASGQVTMVHDDMYYSGGTVILDHGYGLSSTFLHLKEIHVAEGAVLKQGDVIGTVGSSGRSTGAHLDWRINWYDQRIDPAAVAGPMPKSADQKKASSH